MNYVLFSLPVVFLIVSVIVAVRSVKKGTKRQRAVATQLLAFGAVCLITFAVPVIANATTTGSNTATGTSTSDVAKAAEAAATANANASSKGMGLIAAALVTGLAGFGGGIAVAAAAPAAIGATSEDPKSFGKSLIFVALGEGIALYGLLVSILILNKV